MKKYIIILINLLFLTFSITGCVSPVKTSDNYVPNANNAIQLFKNEEAKQIAKQIFKDKKITEEQMVDLINAEVERKVLKYDFYFKTSKNKNMQKTGVTLNDTEKKYYLDLFYKFEKSGRAESVKGIDDVFSAYLLLDLDYSYWDSLK